MRASSLLLSDGAVDLLHHREGGAGLFQPEYGGNGVGSILLTIPAVPRKDEDSRRRAAIESTAISNKVMSVKASAGMRAGSLSRSLLFLTPTVHHRKLTNML